MKRIDDLKNALERLLAAPGEELGRWARLLRFQIQLWRFCARRLRENNATAMSAALSFRTIFAMVPALVLALLVAKSLGVLADSKRSLRGWLETGGLGQIFQPATRPAARGGTTQPAGAGNAASRPAPGPTQQQNVARRIEQLVEQVEKKLTLGRIGPAGVVVLIWTALTLLTTMERSLNRIFGARRSRALGRRVLLYWSAVTLAPVLLGATSYVGAQAVRRFGGVAGASWVLAAVGWTGPILVGIFVLAAVYKLMPNTDVSFRSAIGGAVVAVPLWLAAKWGFGLYVRYLVGGRNLYGALGLIPLFLFWLNLSWLIFLFGAQLAHTAVNLGRMQSAEEAERTVLGPSDLLAAAVAVAQPYVSGSGPVGFRELAERLGLPDASVQRLLERLAGWGMVTRTGAGAESAYVLARPPEKIALLELLELGGSGAVGSRCRGDIARAVQRVRRRAGEALGGWTLADVLAGEGAD